MDVMEKLSSKKRLIDANELKKKMCFKCNDEYSDEPCEPIDCVFCNSINDAQTIDAVPVVRCRECKHCDPENHHCDHHMGTAAPLRRKPDDFCSYGERKEGAD